MSEALFVEKCITEFSNTFQSNNIINDTQDTTLKTEQQIKQREAEENFAKFFFINMNHAIFSGEYLHPDYFNKLLEFEKNLGISDTVFCLALKDAIYEFKNLLTYVEDKSTFSDDKVKFLASLKRSITGYYKNSFFEDFRYISLYLTKIDHFLIKKRENIDLLIVIREKLKTKITEVENDGNFRELYEVYKKLNSKCSFLLKKLFDGENDSSYNYALDFKVYCVQDMELIDDYNKDFDDLFKCLYENPKDLQKKAYEYEKEFNEAHFSTIGFVILGHCYRTQQKDIQQISNLISQFETSYDKQTNNNSIFIKYAIESVRHYLHNCCFALKLEREDYKIDELENDIKQIKEIEKQTKIHNFHPYEKAITFLSNQLDKLLSKSSGEGNIDVLIKIDKYYNKYLEDYKNSIDWCIQLGFYPFQLENRDCINKHKIFMASSFSKALDPKKLNNLYREYRDKRPIIKSALYLQNKMIEIDDAQEKLKSYREESLEYLGIFIAIITFLFGSLQLFGNQNINYSQALMNIVSLGIVLAIFALFLSIILFHKDTNKEAWKNGKAWFMIGVIGIGLLVLYLCNYVL